MEQKNISINARQWFSKYSSRFASRYTNRAEGGSGENISVLGQRVFGWWGGLPPPNWPIKFFGPQLVHNLPYVDGQLAL